MSVSIPVLFVRLEYPPLVRGVLEVAQLDDRGSEPLLRVSQVTPAPDVSPRQAVSGGPGDSQMAVFSVTGGSEAPAVSRTNGRLATRMSEHKSLVTGVKKGQVGRRRPSAGETARSLVLRNSPKGSR